MILIKSKVQANVKRLCVDYEVVIKKLLVDASSETSGLVNCYTTSIKADFKRYAGIELNK